MGGTGSQLRKREGLCLDEGGSLWFTWGDSLGDGAGESEGTAGGFRFLGNRRAGVCAGRMGNFLLRRVRSWGLYLPSPNSQALRARVFLRNGSMALLHAFPPLLLLDWAALWKATGIVQVVGPLQNSFLHSGLCPNLPSPSRALPPTAWDICLGLCGFLREAFRGGCLVPGSCRASLGARTPISANPGAQLALCERDLTETMRIMP